MGDPEHDLDHNSFPNVNDYISAAICILRYYEVPSLLIQRNILPAQTVPLSFDLCIVY
jgi:hypothetical protein